MIGIWSSVIDTVKLHVSSPPLVSVALRNTVEIPTLNICVLGCPVSLKLLPITVAPSECQKRLSLVHGLSKIIVGIIIELEQLFASLLAMMSSGQTKTA